MGRPRVYENADELEIAVDAYFEAEGKKTMTGLALALGFDSRQSLYDYQKNETFSYIINKALLRVECQYEENLSGNNVAGSIFVLKNMGWKDKTEQDLNHSGGLNMVWNEQKTYETK
jgi:hypothetical protein